MKIHVLPGDAQAADFNTLGIDGDVVVCRECLVVGDVRAESLEEFWNVRERFLDGEYGAVEGDYRKRVVTEFEKLINAPSGAEINLWFEYELFCQANMWFCISLLQKSSIAVKRVAPITLRKDEVWKGFGRMSADDLKTCFEERQEFTARDIKLGTELWEAFRKEDHARLKELSKTESACFPYLKEVCDAAIGRNTRPKEIVRQIQSDGVTDFGELFLEFGKRAGVYGFGDDQVKSLLDEA